MGYVPESKVPESKEVLQTETHIDEGMAKGPCSPLKELLMAKAGTIGATK